ncbi:MAG: hypothetical protein ABEJ56_02710 [Candidatus Nanohaloarchaea archaeon]
MSKDDFTCGCGQAFDTLDELKDHAEEEHDKDPEEVEEKFG